jgi:hypothetical protein
MPSQQIVQASSVKTEDQAQNCSMVNGYFVSFFQWKSLMVGPCHLISRPWTGPCPVRPVMAAAARPFFFNQSHWTLGPSHCQDSSDEEECVHDAVPTRAPVAVEAWYQ